MWACGISFGVGGFLKGHSRFFFFLRAISSSIFGFSNNKFSYHLTMPCSYNLPIGKKKQKNFSFEHLDLTDDKEFEFETFCMYFI